MLAILFFVVLVTSKHTSIYEEWKSGEFTGTLFLKNTYLGDHWNIDPCQKIDRKKYIKLLLDNNIACSGTWCVDNEYKCGSREDCYHVEHIIDQKNSNPEYERYDKNILGNVIMAYSQWNMQVGKLSWNDIKEEKREIYGQDIFQKAINNIIACNIENEDDYNDYSKYIEYDVYELILDYIIGMFIMIIILVIIIKTVIGIF